MKSVEENCIQSRSIRNGRYYFLSSKWATTFCENETNNRKIYNVPNEVDYVKDGINDYIVHGKATVNPIERI
jgi:YHS domain-containing protein